MCTPNAYYVSKKEMFWGVLNDDCINLPYLKSLALGVVFLLQCLPNSQS